MAPQQLSSGPSLALSVTKQFQAGSGTIADHAPNKVREPASAPLSRTNSPTAAAILPQQGTQPQVTSNSATTPSTAPLDSTVAVGIPQPTTVVGLTNQQQVSPTATLIPNNNKKQTNRNTGGASTSTPNSSVSTLPPASLPTSSTAFSSMSPVPPSSTVFTNSKPPKKVPVAPKDTKASPPGTLSNEDSPDHELPAAKRRKQNVHQGDNQTTPKPSATRGVSALPQQPPVSAPSVPSSSTSSSTTSRTVVANKQKVPLRRRAQVVPRFRRHARAQRTSGASITLLERTRRSSGAATTQLQRCSTATLTAISIAGFNSNQRQSYPLPHSQMLLTKRNNTSKINTLNGSVIMMDNTDNEIVVNGVRKNAFTGQTVQTEQQQPAGAGTHRRWGNTSTPTSNVLLHNFRAEKLVVCGQKRPRE
eukprot:TRINITY_DN66658_c1_g8_i4.p2 TRINITY_DN66658_c1_g8~~TRINITY_DN66658_c1_g8_i4.p2  ORF type:complete len:419 (-),score=74.45 TRINITY_DN66658_c1_g8_i4:1700-2956(-)